jgi:hypothetical protein
MSEILIGFFTFIIVLIIGFLIIGFATNWFGLTIDDNLPPEETYEIPPPPTSATSPPPPPSSATSTPTPSSSATSSSATSTPTPSSSATSTPTPSSSATSTPPPPPSKTTSIITQTTDGRCGLQNNKRCLYGQCCSPAGYCGTTDEYCIQNPNSDFSGYESILLSNDGRCGIQGNNKRCPNGECCSEWGYCGISDENCILNKNSNFNNSNSLLVSDDNTCGELGNGKRCPNEQCCSTFTGKCGNHMLDCLNLSYKFNGTNPRIKYPSHGWDKNLSNFSYAVPADTNNPVTYGNYVCRAKRNMRCPNSTAYCDYNVLGRYQKDFNNECIYEFGGREESTSNFDLLKSIYGRPVWRHVSENISPEKKIPSGYVIDNKNPDNPNVCKIEVEPNIWAAGKEINGRCLVGYGRGVRSSSDNFQYLTFE